MRSLKPLLRALVPPLVWNGLKTVKTRVFTSADRFVVARDGWATKLPGGLPDQDHWRTHLARERAIYERIVER